MQPVEQRRALSAAVAAARAAGRVMRQNAASAKTIHSATQHDIKLELDVRCQKLIESRLLRAFPASSVFGEEGTAGAAESAWRWVVDPIDGTVNFTYGIPHACVSIALQTRDLSADADRPTSDSFTTELAVVYDPFCEELWTAQRGKAALLNGRRIRVSQRTRLDEAVISLGFGKRRAVLDHWLPAVLKLTHRVRKIRVMGSAALALAYVASGRFDAYVERGVRLWDIAAGGLLVEGAGGEFWRRELPDGSYEVIASNGLLRPSLEGFLPSEKPPKPRRRQRPGPGRAASALADSDRLAS